MDTGYYFSNMSSEEEDADLQALRFAVLASLKPKSKQNETDSPRVRKEDDEDLEALRQAALLSKRPLEGQQEIQPIQRNNIVLPLRFPRSKKNFKPFPRQNNKAFTRQSNPNLIQIRTVPLDPPQTSDKTDVDRSCLTSSQSKAKSMLLRPQDRYCLLNDEEASSSPKVGKAKGNDKFSRFECDSDSEDSDDYEFMSSSSDDGSQELKKSGSEFSHLGAEDLSTTQDTLEFPSSPELNKDCVPVGANADSNGDTNSHSETLAAKDDNRFGKELVSESKSSLSDNENAQVLGNNSSASDSSDKNNISDSSSHGKSHSSKTVLSKSQSHQCDPDVNSNSKIVNDYIKKLNSPEFHSDKANTPNYQSDGAQSDKNLNTPGANSPKLSGLEHHHSESIDNANHKSTEVSNHSFQSDIESRENHRKYEKRKQDFADTVNMECPNPSLSPDTQKREARKQKFESNLILAPRSTKISLKGIVNTSKSEQFFGKTLSSKSKESKYVKRLSSEKDKMRYSSEDSSSSEQSPERSSYKHKSTLANVLPQNTSHTTLCLSKTMLTEHPSHTSGISKNIDLRTSLLNRSKRHQKKNSNKWSSDDESGTSRSSDSSSDRSWSRSPVLKSVLSVVRDPKTSSSEKAAISSEMPRKRPHGGEHRKFPSKKSSSNYNHEKTQVNAKNSWVINRRVNKLEKNKNSESGTLQISIITEDGQHSSPSSKLPVHMRLGHPVGKSRSNARDRLGSSKSSKRHDSRNDRSRASLEQSKHRNGKKGGRSKDDKSLKSNNSSGRSSKEKQRSQKRGFSQSSGMSVENEGTLEAKIQRIQARNAAILKRREEIEADRKQYS